jgi:hypothetical protein
MEPATVITSTIQLSNSVAQSDKHVLVLYRQEVLISQVVIGATLFRKLHSHEPQPQRE